MSWDWDKLQEKRQRQSWGQQPKGEEPPRQNNNEQQKKEQERKPFPTPPRIKVPSNFKAFKWILLVLVLIWLASGIFIVNPDEQGVVLRFGKYVRTVDAGPHYALPFPIETVYRPKVTQVQRIEVGFRSIGNANTFQQGQLRTVPEEAAMLTGDENIANVQFSVQYQIKNPLQYLFNIANPTNTIKSAAESAMREVIGNSKIDSALTDGKLEIQQEATKLLQEILDRYESGIRVIAVQMQDVNPPKEVIDAFKDVASAREDKSRIINEAEAYRSEIIPKARGRAAEILNQAEAYKATRTQEAKGDANRFLAILAEYNKAKDVTKKRLYFEAMEDILSKPGMEKIILPESTSGRALPLLPLFSGNNTQGGTRP